MNYHVKPHQSAIDREGEALWYALFALRGLVAKRHQRKFGRPIPVEETYRLAAGHKRIVQDFFCAMGRTVPGQAR